MSYAHYHRNKVRRKSKKLCAANWQGLLKERIRQILREKDGDEAYRSIETLISVENVNVRLAARILQRSPEHVLVLVRGALLHASARLKGETEFA